MEYYYIDGYAFETKEEYNLAMREQRNIVSIKGRMNSQSKESVLMIYRKLVSKELLVTPIGLEFLRELRYSLINDFHMEATELPMIHVTAHKREEKKSKEEYTANQLMKENNKLKDTLFKLRIFTFGLLIIIVGIFIMTATNPNSAYIDTENKIVNKYASWEEDLQQREKAVKDKEQALGIE